MDGSLLAYMIRSEYPDLDYTKLGLARLGDAVRIAENLELVERHHDVKHLELSPANKNNDTDSRSMSVDERRYVRNDIWRAFVYRRSSQFFIERASCALTEIPENDAKTTETLARSNCHIALARISDDSQIAWAKQYVTSAKSTECSDDDAKSLVFRKTTGFSSSFVRSWKFYLSSKVVDHIKVWAAKNDFSTDGILISIKRKSVLQQSRVKPNEKLLRDAVIAAVKEMPLSELDEISIPIKYIRRHLS